MKICLDPGHGGKDKNDGKSFAGGCYMTEDMSEDDWNLQFCKIIGEALKTHKHEITDTRVGDMLLSRDERNAAAAGADLVLSIHVNSLPGSGGHGLMSFRWPGNKRTKRLAQLVHRYCPNRLFRAIEFDHIVRKNNWTRRARSVVGTYTQDCLLVEVGFSSNKRDLQYLLSDKGKKELSTSLVKAINVFEKEKHYAQCSRCRMDQQISTEKEAKQG